MIGYLLSLLGFMSCLSLPIHLAPAPLIRHGRVSGVRAAKRLAQKRRNRRRACHA